MLFEHLKDLHTFGKKVKSKLEAWTYSGSSVKVPGSA